MRVHLPNTGHLLQSSPYLKVITCSEFGDPGFSLSWSYSAVRGIPECTQRDATFGRHTTPWMWVIRGPVKVRCADVWMTGRWLSCWVISCTSWRTRRTPAEIRSRCSWLTPIASVRSCWENRTYSSRSALCSLFTSSFPYCWPSVLWCCQLGTGKCIWHLHTQSTCVSFSQQAGVLASEGWGEAWQPSPKVTSSYR